MVTKPWSERSKTHRAAPAGGRWARSRRSRASASSRTTPAPLPGGGDFPVDLVIASTAEPEQLHRVRRISSWQKAFESGLFIFADSDLKFDQPQAEVVFDRDKVRSQGVDLEPGRAATSRSMLGGNYVNRFSIQGRSYKVIPQVKRAERLNARPALGDPRHAARRASSSRSRPSPRSQPRPSRASSSASSSSTPCASRASSRPSVTLDQALTFLETEAKALMPPGFTIDYAGESRQLRVEGSSFLGTFLLSAILIYLVLAAQFESFRDPFIILAGSVPLAIAGALLFSFLGFTSLNIYSQVGLITLVGLIVQERHPDRGVRQPPAGDRAWTSCTPSSRPRARACGRSS